MVLAAIVGRADRGNVDDRKALMANALLNEADRLLDMIRASPGGIARACPIGKTRNIKRAVEVSVGRGRAIIAARRGGRILAACHAVDFVVEHDDGQADISPCRVNGVVAADGGNIATMTSSSGVASVIPVAKAMALPCVVWIVLKSR